MNPSRISKLQIPSPQKLSRPARVASLLLDLGGSLRRLRARPWHALAVVLMLGLGLGAATALYSMVNAVLYRSLPVRDPGSLVQLQLAVGGQAGDWMPYPDFTEHRDHNPAFSGALLAQPSEFNLQGEGRFLTVSGAFVSSNFFQVLGVGAAQGRTFGPADERIWDGGVVLGHDLARRLFGDGAAPGRSFSLNGHPCVVAGVARKGFRGTDVNLEAEVWLPFPALTTFRPPAPGQEDEQHSREVAPLVRNQVLARLKPGTGLAQAQAATLALGERIAQTHGDGPSPEGKTMTRTAPLEGSRKASLGNYLPRPSLLFIAAGLLLLLACANVANLQLADTARRDREFAIRLALGAPRSALIRQTLTESLLLALLGTALGLMTGTTLAGLLMRFQAATLMRSRIEPALDARVAAFAVALAVLCAFISGIIPALHTTRTRLTGALGEGARGSSRRGAKELLVAGQIALALALLVASGTVFRSLRQLQGRNPGYDPSQIATLRVRERAEGMTPEQGLAYRRRLLDQVRQLPGVRQAALSAALPRDPLTIRIKVTPEGQDTPVGLPWGIVGPGYFSVMSIPVIQGRSFSDQDGPDAQRVAVVSQSLAKAFWPGGQAIGRYLKGGKGPMQVVGVVGDLDYDRAYGQGHPLVFTPMAQRDFGFTCLLVKTEGDPEAMLPALRRVATEVAPALPIAHLETLERHLEQADGPLRLAAWLLGGFGLLALTLAAFGVYSAQAFRLGERRPELGIRVALGASPGALLRMLLGDTLRWTVLGLAAGGIGAFYLSRSLASLLTGVQAPGIGSYGAGALTLVAAVLAATLPHALAAALTPPAKALRQN